VIDMGFRSSIILLFTALLIITVSVVTTNGYYQARVGILDLSGRVIDEAVNKIVLRTSEVVEIAANNLQLLALAMQDVDIIADHEKILPLLWSANEQSKFYSSTYIADTKGNFLQARKQPNPATRINYLIQTTEIWQYRDNDYAITATIKKPLDYNPLQRPWYQKAVEQGKMSWSDVYVWAATGELGITVSYPILGKDGLLQGVLGIDIGLSGLNAFVTEERLGENSILLIVNDIGQIIAHPLSNIAIAEAGGEKKLLDISDLRDDHYHYIKQAWADVNAEQEKVLNLNLQGSSYFVKKQQISSVFANNWYLLMIVPNYVVMDTVDRGLYTSIMFAIIMLIIAIYAIYLISNRLSTPLHQIVHNADLLNQFRFNEIQPVKAVFAEFKLLDQSMQSMKRSLIAFNRYVPTNLVRQLLSNQQKEVSLGGETKPLILLSCSINDFANSTANMQANDKVLYLSRYQTEMIHILHSNDATIDTFMADRVISFWGAPIPSTNDAYRACIGALNCLQAIDALNQDLRLQNLPAMQIRLALHTDDCIVGNFGAPQHMFYSILGDGVELVHWLENLNKIYASKIIISGTLYELVKNDFIFKYLDKIKLPNGHDMDIYELIADKNLTTRTLT
jgi:adenylate cyclase